MRHFIKQIYVKKRSQKYVADTDAVTNHLVLGFSSFFIIFKVRFLL